MNHSTPGLPVHHQLPEFTQTHVHRVGDAIQPSHPLLSPSPPAPNPSSIRVFSNESTLRMRWPKYWSFSFSISPSKEHPGLISFRMDWLDLLAVEGTLKSLLQHHSSKTSILWHSAFFTIQLSHPYMTTGKTKALLHSAKVRFYFPLNNDNLYKKFNDISLFIEFSNLLTLLIHFPCNFGLNQHGLWSSLVDQMVKNLPWEIWVWSLGWEDPLEEDMASLSSIPAWRIPMDREAWWATVHGAAKSRT